ncbi:MAG: thermonuclease family protein [Gammaproteobacteria bacterium]
MPVDEATIRVLLTLLFVCTSLHAEAGDKFEGQVKEVFDGDSFVMETTLGDEIQVRLFGIDAPERDQPYAESARKALTDLIVHERIRVESVDVDRFGRQVARAFRLGDGLDVNAEMVKQGHAWVYRQYTREKKLYELESAARAQQRGLWALPEEDILPPWQWRREVEKKANAKNNTEDTENTE